MKEYKYFSCYPESVTDNLNKYAVADWTLVSLRRKTSTDLIDIVMERNLDEAPTSV